ATSSSCSISSIAVRWCGSTSSFKARENAQGDTVSLGPLMVDWKGYELDAEEREWLQSPLVAGAILFKRNYASREQLEALVRDIHAVRSPPLLVAVDQEGGRVQRFGEPFFKLPPMRALGRLYDENPDAALQTAAAFGWLMAAELRA